MLRPASGRECGWPERLVSVGVSNVDPYRSERLSRSSAGVLASVPANSAAQTSVPCRVLTIVSALLSKVLGHHSVCGLASTMSPSFIFASGEAVLTKAVSTVYLWLLRSTGSVRSSPIEAARVVLAKKSSFVDPPCGPRSTYRLYIMTSPSSVSTCLPLITLWPTSFSYTSVYTFCPSSS